MSARTRQRRNDRREPGPVPLLAAVLEGTTDLADAACIGRPELFDPAEPSEDAETAEARHHRARAICRRCPVLAQCGNWADDHGGIYLSAMVVAGREPIPEAENRRRARRRAA